MKVDDTADFIDVAAAAVGNPPFGVLECLKASTARFLAQAGEEILSTAAKKRTRHIWFNAPDAPLTMAFLQMCDCLALLRDGIHRGDPLEVIPDTLIFVQESVIDIFKKSDLECASFTDDKFKAKTKDWFNGSTRYGNGSQTNNIAADTHALRTRQLLESMHGDAPRLSRGVRLSTAILGAPPRDEIDHDATRELFGGSPPPAAQQPGPQQLLSHLPRLDNNHEWTQHEAAAPSNDDDDAHRLTAAPALAEPYRPSLTAAFGTDILGADDSSAAGKAFDAVYLAAIAAGNVAGGTMRLANKTVQWGSANFRRNQQNAHTAPAPPRVSTDAPAAASE
jgi:hypothetical protein